jgi:hypothetical protein
MQNSLFLAKLIGPFFLLVGVSLLVNPRAFRETADEFLRSPALLFLSALMIFPAGLAIVLTHNVWVANWPVIITLLGWLCVISGIIRLMTPQKLIAVGYRLHRKPKLLYVSAGIWTAIGAVLCFFGYLK